MQSEERILAYLQQAGLSTARARANLAELKEDYFNQAADLADAEAWPHERPERENQILYKLADRIRSAGRDPSSSTS